MTTTEPVIVSNTVLAPGIHTWRLLDSAANRHVVQITNETTNRVEAVILAIPNYRRVITSNNDVRFWETPAGYARAVRSWFLPGDNFGQEFPYSRKVVLSLGRLIPPPVPAISHAESQLASPRNLSKSISLAAQSESGATQWPDGSWAIITEGRAATAINPNPEKMRPHAGVWDRLKHLPLTATIVPLIGLIGAGFVLAAFLLSSKRKYTQTQV